MKLTVWVGGMQFRVEGDLQREEQATLEHPGCPAEFEVNEFAIVLDDGTELAESDFPTGFIADDFARQLADACLEKLGDEREAA
jgi:hypothetical protein